MKTFFFLVFFSVLWQLHLSAQGKIGVEQYNYLNAKPTIQPICHIESSNNWHAELRYNYEDAETFSVYGGKKFVIDGDLQVSITPMIGYSIGTFTGVSLAFNTEAEYKRFYFGSQTQYSRATKKNIENFFFSWSELVYNISKKIYSGLAIQYTLQKELNELEPGFVAGISFDNIGFPFYIFSPFNPGRYFIVGIIYEFSLRKKK